MYGQLILLAVLILINAYFAAAEMAIVSANKNRIRTLANEGNKKAVILNKLIDEPNKFLSASSLNFSSDNFSQLNSSLILMFRFLHKSPKIE